MPDADMRLDAWRAVVASQAAVTHRVKRALDTADLPPLSWFELLAAVERAPAGPPRMNELAERLTLTRGGITKLVDRLQEAGYVERVSCTEDRRSLRAKLTPDGEAILAAMRTVYERELALHLGTLSAAEAQVIAAALHKVAASTCAEAGVAVPGG